MTSVQSGVYRTTLAAVLVCPVASALLAGAGLDGLTIRLSFASYYESVVKLLPVIQGQ